MKFWQRFRYYLIGVSIGLIASVFFFQNRGCGWLPQNRVLDKISNSVITRTDSMKCVMECHGITDEDVFHLLQYGDVLFSESNVQTTPRMYVISAERLNDEKEYKLAFILHDTTTLISGVISSEKCNCGDKDDKDAHILYMPDEMVKKMFLKKDISITETGNCKMNHYGLHPDTVVNYLKSGTIDNVLSTPLSEPHPRYFVRKKNVLLQVEMAEKKNRIIDVIVEGDTTTMNCE
ncbi:MAG: hypothetical protein K1X56_08325 [Flavobacteriales bacterium]|nr:hypothetical protein [Flavobacteriales bacterium]